MRKIEKRLEAMLHFEAVYPDITFTTKLVVNLDVVCAMQYIYTPILKLEKTFWWYKAICMNM